MSAAGFFLLDIGNSAAKWLHGRQAEILGQGAAALDAVAGLLAERDPRACVLVSSVASEQLEVALRASLAETGRDVWFASSRARHGDLHNAYADPERMGVDRWLAMIAGRRRCEERFCVVDAGTALTIDLVGPDGLHEGGYIIPGSALMARALTLDTQRVRFELPEQSSLAPGRSTQQAVGHGIALAQAGAVELALTEAAKQGPAPRLMLCGGGAAALAGLLERDAALTPHLVLEGLLGQGAVEAPDLLDYQAVLAALLEHGN